MKWKIKSRTTKNHVGRKQDEKEHLLSLYSLYDTCDKCPLWVYVDVVCRDNLQSLIINGNPSMEILEKTKIDLLIEFSELSENLQTRAVNSSLRQMYTAKTHIMELEICVELIASGIYKEPFDVLSKMGLSFQEPKNDEDLERIIKRITGFTKGKIIQFNEAHKRYLKMTETSNAGAPTVQSYVDQLALISKHIGFNISLRNITLAEYASYLKIYRHGYNKQQ